MLMFIFVRGLLSFSENKKFVAIFSVNKKHVFCKQTLLSPCATHQQQHRTIVFVYVSTRKKLGQAFFFSDFSLSGNRISTEVLSKVNQLKPCIILLFSYVMRCVYHDTIMLSPVVNNSKNVFPFTLADIMIFIYFPSK